jgi:hypothetical protein
MTPRKRSLRVVVGRKWVLEYIEKLRKEVSNEKDIPLADVLAPDA